MFLSHSVNIIAQSRTERLLPDLWSVAFTQQTLHMARFAFIIIMMMIITQVSTSL